MSDDEKSAASVMVGGGVVVVINPGTEPVEDADERAALESVAEFVRQLGLDGTEVERICKADYGEGRFGFRVNRGGHSCEIQMPGLPPAALQLGPWRSPRLYVDGSSWLWEFALRQARAALTTEAGDE